MSPPSYETLSSPVLNECAVYSPSVSIDRRTRARLHIDRGRLSSSVDPRFAGKASDLDLRRNGIGLSCTERGVGI